MKRQLFTAVLTALLCVGGIASAAPALTAKPAKSAKTQSPYPVLPRGKAGEELAEVHKNMVSAYEAFCADQSDANREALQNSLDAYFTAKLQQDVQRAEKMLERAKKAADSREKTVDTWMKKMTKSAKAKK